MIRINLLPHRELKRAARQNQFNILALGVVSMGLVTAILVHTAISGKIDTQNSRNTYLEAETAKLDSQINEIKKLKEQTQSLLSRKQVVETLQSDRAQAVHLLDQIARQLPEGVYIKAIKQDGNKVTLVGYAQSNARVSTLMRNLEASTWLELPTLVEIKSATINSLRTNEFTLDVKLTPPHMDNPTSKDKKA